MIICAKFIDINTYIYSMIEIERKFLVKELPELERYVRQPIKQGFLNSEPERTVRVRIMGTKAFLTVKGIGDPTGLSRFEWEKEIPVSEAEQLLKIAEPGVIDKTRVFIPKGKHTIELDIFHGDNEGLIVAEVELNDEAEQFEKPGWLGEEVTGKKKFYNSALAKNPFIDW